MLPREKTICEERNQRTGNFIYLSINWKVVRDDSRRCRGQGRYVSNILETSCKCAVKVEATNQIKTFDQSDCSFSDLIALLYSRCYMPIVLKIYGRDTSIICIASCTFHYCKSTVVLSYYNLFLLEYHKLLRSCHAYYVIRPCLLLVLVVTKYILRILSPVLSS
jgi:hypothetical protein